MRILFFIVSLFLLFGSCNSKTNKKEEKVKKQFLFGSFQDGEYVNPFFNFIIDFDEDWEVDTKSFKSTSFGGELFEANYLNSVDQEYPIKIVMEADKANPFGSKSPVEKLKESQEGYEMFISDDELAVSDYTKVSIAGENFAHAQFMVIDEYDTSYVHEYYRFQDGFFLSIIGSYSTKMDEEVFTNFISSVKKNK